MNSFLEQLEASNLTYVGSPGRDQVDSFQVDLGLQGKTFCMGGPGYFIRDSLLQRMHRDQAFQQCLDTSVSPHSDTEIGRCMQNYNLTGCQELPNGPIQRCD